MFDVNTTDVRQFFAAAWKNRFTPLDANQERAVRIIQAHPEYHRYLNNFFTNTDKTNKNGIADKITNIKIVKNKSKLLIPVTFKISIFLFHF